MGVGATRTLDTDYLVVGAGAMGMAFTDALVDHADVHVTLVDRRHAPGGHWNDAYPFVQLHQASLFYGVDEGEDVLEVLLAVLHHPGVDDDRLGGPDHHRVEGDPVGALALVVVDEERLGSDLRRGQADHRTTSPARVPSWTHRARSGAASASTRCW